MVSKEQLIKFILEKFPGFEKIWNEHREWWGEEEAGLYNDMSAFSDYVIDLLKADIAHEEIKKIFIVIEALMNSSDDDVKNAVATCFLENLINVTSWERISATTFVHLLGDKSKKFCKDWDEFSGVKTEGLWDDYKTNDK